MCINPENGKIDFEYPWRSKKYESVNASTPIVFDNKIYISATYETGGTLLEVQKDFSHKVLWTTDELNCHWITPVYHEGFIYGLHGRHSRRVTLVCLNAKTGKKVWDERVLWKEKMPDGDESRFGIYLGAILKADGQFYCLSELGHILWLDLNPKGYKIRSKKRLFTANQTWCSPVISKGLLYVVQNMKDHIDKSTPRIRCYDIRGE